VEVSDPIEIRVAVAADGEALVAIDRATWSPANSVGPRPTPGQSFFHARRPPADTLVATAGEAVVGYVILARPTALESNRHVLAINGIAVDPRHQRRGVARSLLEAAAREAGSRGARRLTLRVLSTNPAAQGLYESAGFAVEGVLREEFRLDGAYVDDVLMARYL
jgi:ribosomal protein S18 acetylase RimI-like enzyme